MDNERVLVSVDPGIHGALALKRCNEVEILDFPTYTVTRKITSGAKKGKVSNKNYYDLPELVKLFPHGPGDFIIEDVQRMPNDSAHASSLLLEGKGFFRGISASKNLIEHMVRPSVWKKKLGLPKGATKEDSRQLALKWFPQLADKLSRKKDEGRAEALLLLYYLENFVLNN